jgi:FlaA1/EpsC-like NDP-sugar epimerase
VGYTALSYLASISSFRKQLFLALLDASLTFFTLTLSLWLFQLRPLLLDGWILFFAIGTRLLVFYGFKLYQRLWRYASVIALLDIFFAVSVSSLLFLWVIPKTVVLTEWAFGLIFLGGFRLILRILREFIIDQNPHNSHPMKRALIIGAGDAGVSILREMRRTKSLNYSLLGFLDDDPNKQGLSIHGIKVLGTTSDLHHWVAQLGIEEVVIAIPSAPGHVIRQLLNQCNSVGIPGKITPGLIELMSGRVPIDQIRDIRIEDLLGREVVEDDLSLTLHSMAQDVVLVTGAGGSIGSELCRQILTLCPKQLIIFDHSEHALYQIDQELRMMGLSVPIRPIVGDVQNRETLTQVFTNYNITSVYHAAAYKHVPLMEENILRAIQNNVFGTQNMIEMSEQFKARRFVLISTDKAVNPTSVMGSTKRICELLLQAKASQSSTIFTAVRFGNVLGSSGSVVPLFKKQIQQGGPLTVTHPEMTRYFMTIPEAVRLVIQAGYLAKGGEIFILDMGEPVKILNLAKDMIYLSGLKEDQDIQIVFTGLRPGEKLFEELQLSTESLIPTPNQKIFMTAPLPVDSELYSKINTLLDPNLSSEMLREQLLSLAGG